MKAIGYYAPLPATDEQALVDLELPTPEPGPRDLQVAVKAVSVNPVDVKLRAGARPPPNAARILGFDAAGVVQAVGAEVTSFKPGDPVFYAGAIDRPGTNSEFHLVDERLAALKPRSLSFAESAALPLTSLTAWELLFDRLGISLDGSMCPDGTMSPDKKSSGGTLLIINGAGGVGSILTQMAHRLTGLTVIATASRPQSMAWCRSMGADQVIDHRKPLDQGLEAIGISEVSYVAGLTATDTYMPAIAAVIAPQGKLALIDDPPVLDIVRLKRKSVSVHWELMFTRSLFQTSDMIAQHRILRTVAELVDGGRLRTTLTENLGPLSARNLRRAHGLVEQGRGIGKLVLEGFEATS